MNFRSSIYMPAHLSGAEVMTWQEIHKSEHNYTVVTLVGNPDNFLRPGVLARFFSKKRPDVPPTLPTVYVSYERVGNLFTAIGRIFAWEEQQVASGAQLMDVGIIAAKRFGGVEHYIHYAALNPRLTPYYPQSVMEHASNFIRDMGFRYLVGSASKALLDRTRAIGPLYAQFKAGQEAMLAAANHEYNSEHELASLSD